MKDFSDFMPMSHNDKLINSGRIIFEKQLQGVEASDIVIDGISERGIVYNHLNVLSESKEFRQLDIRENVVINKGSYVIYDDENYITVTDVDNHYVYKSCKISKCNQMLKWRDKDGIIREYPCIISNDSYGSKLSSSSDQFFEIDSKMKIEVQANMHTSELYPDMRFMFNKSKHDIYKCINMTTSIAKGIITLVSEKDILIPEDSLENNLCYNKTLKPTPTKYRIIGDSQIKINNTKSYSIEPITNVTWELDDVSICEISRFDDNSCDIKALTKDELITLSAKVDGVEIAKINIETMR